MKAPIMVDLGNVYRGEDMKKRGFAYTSIGVAPKGRGLI
jgi:hypothetical protein